MFRYSPGATRLLLMLSLVTATRLPARKPAKVRPAPETAAAIDSLFEKSWKEQKVTPAPLADDAEFLRRVYLDITGKLPGAARAKAFLDGGAPDKRARLIDELLAAPEYGGYFARTWRNLM